ncbi:MAG: hypothetical protein C0402_08960 [Thermodesulfovibrio sp.]|nr:hypothetical protein [Thermodesulfovibrio sp.]
MDETANFKMQCPKCGKDFPFDATHCEECSAMLEPVETTGNPSVLPADGEEMPGRKPEEGKGSLISSDRIEDIKIDSLKADIENQFLFTLLLELDQLRNRLIRKEKLLEQLHDKQNGMVNAEYISQTGREEKEIESILTKTARIEMILENLEKNIASDIKNLEEIVRGLTRPSFSERFFQTGRYYRMITSELQIKTVLLDIIRGKLPRSYFRTKRMVRMIALGITGIVCTLLLSWFIASHSQPLLTERPAAATPAPVAAVPAVSEEDIRRLLEDIRTANITKDLKLWESRYAADYRELKGKRESILEQWKQFDYLSLRYRVEDLQPQGAGADAVIVWDIELKPVKGGGSSKITSRLASTFVRENGTLKISAVKKDER